MIPSMVSIFIACSVFVGVSPPYSLCVRVFVVYFGASLFVFYLALTVTPADQR